MGIKVMGLDLAAVNSGLCVIEVGPSLEYEVIYEEALKHPKDDFENRIQAAQHIRKLAKKYRLDLVVIEDYAYRVARNNTSAYQHGEIGGMVRKVLFEDGYTIFIIPPTTMRSFMEVPPKSKKTFLMDQAKTKMGFEATGTNQLVRGNITDAFIHAYTGAATKFAEDGSLEEGALDAAQHRVVFGDDKFDGLLEREGLWYGKER